jgi:DNA-binding ferritin-like protein
MRESIEIYAIAPDPGYGIALENMVAMWGNVPYGELSVMLVYARFLACVHQTHHWQAKGDPFYGDHLLFERLYGVASADIDVIAEKAVGLGCTENVNLLVQSEQVAQLSKSYGVSMTIPTQSDLARRSLVAEQGFARCVEFVTAALRDKGLLTRGLDNMLAGIQDAHENSIYLLKQRCSTV